MLFVHGDNKIVKKVTQEDAGCGHVTLNGCYGGDEKEIAQIRSRTNSRVGRDETLMTISGLSVWKFVDFTIIGVQVARVKNKTFSLVLCVTEGGMCGWWQLSCYIRVSSCSETRRQSREKEVKAVIDIND